MSYYPYQPPVVVSPPQSSTAHIVIAWVVTVLTAFYMLPWAIAATRNRSNVASIALINLFLGWSLVGWVVALVMACGSEPTASVTIVNAPQYYSQQGYAGQSYQQSYPPAAYGSHPQVNQWTQQTPPPMYGPAQHSAPPPALYGSQPAIPGPTLPPAFGQASFDPSSTLPEATRPLPVFPDEAAGDHRRQ